MRTFLVVVAVLSTAFAQRGRNYREDGKCGPGNLAEDGNPASCEHIPPFPTCCQLNGHCGWDCEEVQGSLQPAPAPAPPVEQPVFTSNGKYRSDGKCGSAFPLEDGTPAECDPNSEFWCCSEHGFCGGTQEHCYCDTCVNYRPINVRHGVRSDRRCGKEFPLEDGTPSKCDGKSANHCCSSHGYCGPGSDHCDCIGCTDYRGAQPKEVPLLVGKVRNDRRCGASFPLDNGLPSECDPSGPNPCCSKWGYCGPGADHCECAGCKDYRTADQRGSDFVGKVRKDRRCGFEFPLPDGQGPSQCDPNSANFCCSKWGYCGGDSEHCDCPECVNYQKVFQKK